MKDSFDAHPMDQIVFGLSHYTFNSKADSNSNKDDEIDFELNYVHNRGMIRLNFQYVYQPNGLDTIDDAWVAGVSVKLNF